MHACIPYTELQVPFQTGRWSSGFLASWCSSLEKESCCSRFGDVNDMIAVVEPSLTVLYLPLPHPAFYYWQSLGGKETSFLIPEDSQPPVSSELYFSSLADRPKWPSMAWTGDTVTYISGSWVWYLRMHYFWKKFAYLIKILHQTW